MWPVAEYLVNYEYIVNVLCENKDRPEMECNGKCYLSDELAKEAADGDKNPLRGKTQKTEIPQFVISYDIAEFIFASATEPKAEENIGYKTNLSSSLFTSKILHPPRIA